MAGAEMIEAPPDYGSMGVVKPLVPIPEVGMGIEMQQEKIRIHPEASFDKWIRDGVLTAQCQEPG
jgi:hypothetical protein